MINILRKNQKALWVVIAILCVPFVFYFSNSDVGALRDNSAGTLYGRKISEIEFQRNARLFNVARELGMSTYLQTMVGGAQSLNEAYQQFAWNRLILRHEAERLGIQPTSEEIANVVKTMQPFRGEKGFEINKYNEFVKAALPAMGFTEAQIEEVAADQLIFNKLKQLLATGVQIPEAESREYYERAYGKMSVAVVRVNSDDLAKDIQVTDEDIAKYYEANKAELKSEEKRKVSFVSFGLSEEQKKLTGKERVEVLQKLADKASDFNQALLEKGAEFEAVAAKFQLPIQTTGDFTRSAPDPLFSANPQLTDAAFQLKPAEPNSDATQAGDGFHVLHLAGIDEAKPLTLEEARPRIVDAIKQQRTRELASAKGAEAVAKIREALAAGSPIDAALQQTGLPMEKIPPFALAEPAAMQIEPNKPPQPQSPDLQMIKSSVAELAPGEVSEFIPTPAGGVVAVLEKRDSPDPAAAEKTRASFNTRYLESKREVAFYEWLRERRREAGVKPPKEELGDEAAG